MGHRLQSEVKHLAPGDAVEPFALRTLTAGRGFRWHGQVTGIDEDAWIYGHGAKDPSLDGWVPARNTTC